MKICVIGLGYIGLPTAAMFARAGMDVLGVDRNRVITD
ncbi:MAG TPA: 3-hydroxyacyl-CoA dehydrogenase NAD-binding domain-containing protein, partial [Anaerovoracaceae bacterium]|nr:3-hydroxyacyl-CoA dehydrogenase NAD-binding domain-containing protein [Anaerovoracaceae bacterium]